MPCKAGVGFVTSLGELAIDFTLEGEGADPIVLPTFTAPALPAGVAPVAPGVLSRIFDFVEVIKASPGYNDTIGQDLGLIGSEVVASQTAPLLKCQVLDGTTCNCVRLTFVKYGHMGVYLESRRNGGPWEFLTIDTETPYNDERPLLSPSVPEIREYRARFWDKGTPNGEWTDVVKVTVSPS